MKNKIWQLVCSILVVGLGAQGAAAAGIDATNKYSWSEGAGYWSWDAGMGDAVDVEQEYISGYVWSENAGWIHLGEVGVPPEAGSQTRSDYGIRVTMNGSSADLSGYVWGETAGWINFDPLFGGVTISSEGTFEGYAWSENMGWVSLSDLSGLPNYAVQTEALGEPGDVNMDGSINDADVQLLAEILNGDYTSEEIADAGWKPDVNRDGSVNILDMSKLLEILNK